MTLDFEQIEQQIETDKAGVSDDASLEAFRIKYLGRKGLLAEIYATMGAMSKEEKPLIGKLANTLRQGLTQYIDESKRSLKEQAKADGQKPIDVTIPGVASAMGHTHLLTQTLNEICDIFEKLGFVVQEGPEVETEFNNFTALNIPEDHPSRDGFDTFYLEEKDPSAKGKNLLLRSHTSPAQIRIMEQFKPPLAVIVPGKVYRPDAVDASHSFMFNQIEGLLVGKDLCFSDLKGLLTSFCQQMFGKDIKMRFRPHFFPFTEPSAEVDISWTQGKKTWLEIMGCGMVHPKVFEAVGYPKNKYTGLAFGLGVDRIAMLKYGIKDIRVFYENDARFLKQF